MTAVTFPATRWSLIARLPEHPQHVAVLVGLYADAIGAYLAMKLSGERRERIEDTVQEVLLDLLAKPEVLAKATPGSGSRFRYYLMNLAWLSARNHLRHARRRDHSSLDARSSDGGPARIDALADESSAAETGDAAMDRAWALSVVRQALDDLQRWTADGTLEPEAFAVLEANLIGGQGLREIGVAMGMSAATCSRRLARARMMLQRTIADRLRLAGELGANDDAGRACAVLLESLAVRC